MHNYYIFFNNSCNVYEVIEEKFNFFAFIFSEIWLLFNKFFGLSILFFISIFLIKYHKFSLELYFAFIICFKVILGLYAPDLLKFKLKLEGYQLKGMVLSSSKETALQRYLDYFN
ncbi:MAG: hypothetical protein J0H68_06860 [Sphingobacteriia bacterium]|nr:hypothetical protein [Sphingobacteriia bacterium]